MTPHTAPLPRLVSLLGSSLALYVADAGIWTYPGAEEIKLALADLADDHRSLIDRAGAVLEDRGADVPRRPYPIQFTCTLADNKRQLAGAELYVRDDLITLVPTFEQLDGGLLSRSRESVVLVTVPPGTLRPGTFKVTLVGERTSRTWSLQVH